MLIIDVLPYLLIIVVLGFFILKRREHLRLLKTEKEVFATTYDINTVYEILVKQVKDWRRRSLWKRSLNPLKWGIPKFAVYKDVQPRLYRVLFRDMGFFTFELAPIDYGGTSVNVSYSPKGSNWVKAFKAKLPIKGLSNWERQSCPSCLKNYPPSCTYCPYCGVALP